MNIKNKLFSLMQLFRNPGGSYVREQYLHKALKVDSFRIKQEENHREILRQARWTFNIVFLQMLASSIVNIVGIYLLLSGQSPEGIVTSVVGVASYIAPTCCLRQVEKANNRLLQASLNK
jgi:hypothetical protein